MKKDINLESSLENLNFNVAILAVGTEITTGQILNSNTQWLSQELFKEGFAITHHMAVPDDHELIYNALKFLTFTCSCNLIFVTGGLGPTTDDFTREVVAKFVKQPLNWSEDNWARVVAKLNFKSVQIRDMHKNQSYFPKDAIILENQVGTADGFSINFQGLNLIQVYVLPGPPKELQNIYTNEILPKIKNLVPENLKWTQIIYTTTGLPESEVAASVNSVLSKEDSQLIAYRVHKPMVDVKLIFQKKDQQKFDLIAQKIHKALKDHLV